MKLQITIFLMQQQKNEAISEPIKTVEVWNKPV